MATMSGVVAEEGTGQGEPGGPQVVPLRPETLARLKAEHDALAMAQAAWQGGVMLLACELGVDSAKFLLDFGVGFVEKPADGPRPTGGEQAR